jgi:hypothetical protein
MSLDLIREQDEKLSPVERLEALCDRGSLTLMRSDVRSRRMGEKAQPGDGVIAGAGRVDGRPVFCYAQDPSYLGGSLGEQHADSIVKVLRLDPADLRHLRGLGRRRLVLARAHRLRDHDRAGQHVPHRPGGGA